MHTQILVDKQFLCYNSLRSDRPLTLQRIGPRQGRNRIVWLHKHSRGETKRHYTRKQLIWLLLGLVLTAVILTKIQYSKPLITALPQQAELSEPAHTQIAPPVAPPAPPQPKTAPHSVKANGKIDPAKLEAWLKIQKFNKNVGSPLAPYAAEILQSDYWSTIIGICYIEQNHCTSAPAWNYWGIASGATHYQSAEQSIAAIDTLLTHYESTGHTTIEKLNGYYVQPANPNWLNIVIKIKAQVEGL